MTKTKITNDRVRQFLAYYMMHPAWGVFHCSLDDGNFDCGASAPDDADDQLTDMVHWFNSLTEEDRETLLKKVKAKAPRFPTSRSAPVEAPKTVAQITSISREERLIRALSHRIEAAKGALDNWKVELNGHPKHAFQWADSAFEAAAQIFVFENALRSLKESFANDFSGFVAFAMRRAVEESRDRSRSTSVARNHIAQCVTTAWAELVMITDTIPE